jgi:hypothetical protein
LVSPDNIGFAEGSGTRDEGTVIVDPRGTVLAKTENHHEEIVRATIPIASFRKTRRVQELPMALLLPVLQQYQPVFGPNAFLEKLPANYQRPVKWYASGWPENRERNRPDGRGGGGLNRPRRASAQEVHLSDWQPIVQSARRCPPTRTGDPQWIHVDVERARRESPYGAPIAHGYLTLSSRAVARSPVPPTRRLRRASKT